MSEDFMDYLDPAAAALLQQMAEADPNPVALKDQDIDVHRASLAQLTPLVRQESPAGLTVVNTTYPNASGELDIRIIAKNGAAERPVLVFFFGGGFIAGNIDSVDSPVRQLVDKLDVVAVLPQYRLAPENPFPAGPDDAYAATLWVAENVAQYGGDPTRIVVSGESSGGNLAAVTALRVRNEGGPALVGQILLEPTIDHEFVGESKTKFAEGPFLLGSDVLTMFDYYLAGDTTQHANPYVSPLRAESLAGLPPALILTAECDLLRDEAEAYADALSAAGVPARAHRFPGLIHGSFALQSLLPTAQEGYLREIRAFLAPILEPESASS